MKPKYYAILSQAVEDGCRMGVSRAFKHTDDPSYELIENECHHAIMLCISNMFEFDRVEES